MSSVVNEPLPSDDFSSVTSDYGNQTKSQHELHVSSDAGNSSPTVAMNKPKTADSEADISAVQKMMSAVSGSLLTSLLGIPTFEKNPFDLQLIQAHSDPP